MIRKVFTKSAATFGKTHPRRYFSISNITRDIKESSSSSSISSITTSDVLPSTVDTAAQTAMHIGDLKAKGLCHWTPPGLLESLMEYVHVTSGISWGMTILLSAVTIRSLLLPLAIKGQRSAAKLANISDEARQLNGHMQAARSVGDLEGAQKYMRDLMQLYKDNNVNPLDGLKIGLISGPVFASFFLALRDISALDLPVLREGGLLWFTNLNVPDPYYILPVLACGSFLLIVEKGMEMPASNPQSKMMKNIFRVMTVAGFPFMAAYPSALSLYWFTNSMVTMAITLSLRHPRMKQIFNIPAIKVPGSPGNEQAAAKSLKMPTFKESVESSLNVVGKDHPNHPIIKAMKSIQKKKATQ